MATDFGNALTAGFERLTAWADLLDRINVFPIADGDTGRNLVISLTPLRHPEKDEHFLARNLLLSARGNSGNIATAFFLCFIQAGIRDTLPLSTQRGRDRARLAVPDPRPGTMLSFFDALASVLPDLDILSNASRVAEILAYLKSVVEDTMSQQSKLQQAQVVDAGALGMFLYFEGFLHVFSGKRILLRPVTETFQGKLQISNSYREELETGYCVDTVIRSDADMEEVGQILASVGTSVIVNRDDTYLKLHFHTGNREDVQQKLNKIGKVMGWEEDDLYYQTSVFGGKTREPAIHIITDAAGSVTRQEAKTLGISLLDSYITVGRRSLPETYITPAALYAAMREGLPVSTAQASIFERHQIYESVMSRYRHVLYLCVGSAFTGNYRVVMEWKQDHDPENRLMVIDTGAASGRLGLLALATASFTLETDDIEQVVAYALKAISQCQEYVFLDRLEYLAAGGRLSKTGAFFGDMIRLKPIVSPMAEGARKVGVVRNREEQLRFALEALERSLQPEVNARIMLEYSDNKNWVEEVRNDVVRRYPNAQIVLHPLSLTSGAHMGPGTWALAFLPEFQR
jgi:hypothetical protein